MPAHRGLWPTATVPDRERRDGGPERVIGPRHPAKPLPVSLRWRHEIGEPAEKLNRRKVDDAFGARPRGLPASALADPDGGFVPG
jgi:hypothetical protein